MAAYYILHNRIKQNYTQYTKIKISMEKLKNLLTMDYGYYILQSQQGNTSAAMQNAP